MHLVCVPVHGSARGDPFYDEILAEARRRLGPAGEGISVTEIQAGHTLMELLAAEGTPPGFADGVVFAAYVPSDEEIAFLAKHDIPCVLIGRPEGDERIPHVEGDHAEGARAGMRHLLDHGHRRVALLVGPLDCPAYADRIAGYKSELVAAGIDLDDDLVIETVAWDREAGRRACERMLDLDPRPTAAMSCGDWSTFGALEAAAARGVRVPDDLAVVMIDYFPWIERDFPVAMTAVQESPEALMRVALDLLQAERRGELTRDFRRKVQSALYIRASCGCTPAAGA